ncbi:MAG: VOC family protein [Alphaproteobacteria bacterium]|nr:VOC family protein [Alphaproteobacteria bacterium]
MAKLRHIAIAVPDVERSAQFYEKVFELERVGTTDSDLATGIYLSDGVISLALLNYKTDEAAGKERGKDYVGVHHVGFWVDDLEDMEKTIENGGGTFFLDLPEAKDSLYYEKKYRDPDGIIFDISHNGWVGASK